MRDTANKCSLGLCASIVLLFLYGCSKWCVSVVFMTGKVIGNWIALGESARQGKSPMLGNGDFLE